MELKRSVYVEGREGAAHFRRRGLGTSAAELWPAQGVFNCESTVAIASRLALHGSMYVAERNGVGMGAGASSVFGLGAQQSPLVLSREC